MNVLSSQSHGCYLILAPQLVWDATRSFLRICVLVIMTSSWQFTQMVEKRPLAKLAIWRHFPWNCISIRIQWQIFLLWKMSHLSMEFKSLWIHWRKGPCLFITRVNVTSSRSVMMDYIILIRTIWRMITRKFLQKPRLRATRTLRTNRKIKIRKQLRITRYCKL